MQSKYEIKKWGPSASFSRIGHVRWMSIALNRMGLASESSYIWCVLMNKSQTSQTISFKNLS